jgi:integrase
MPQNPARITIISGELINGGVSLPTIRKRLGHKNLQTTLRYAEQAVETADSEIRTWRHRTSQRA